MLPTRLAAVGTAPTCIVVEVPHRELGCATLAWDDLVALSETAREFNCPLHMDGAPVSYIYASQP